MEVVRLAAVDAGMIGLVGGKAAGLGELIKAGERVPDGFCITAGHPSHPLLEDLRTGILNAYRRLGAGPVAVRSSATAEDLPQASFAGQQDTFLDVRGEDALLDAVRRCRESLFSERALAYREANGIAHDSVRMAVVVQRMVDPAAAGVLFTANPITGTRTELVIDAVAGRGDAVVDGSVTADHYVLDGRPPTGPTHGCLDAPQLRLLQETGRRVEANAGLPQDIEWAIDRDGTLWLLQSRPITTLFPLPASGRPGPRVYLEVGHMQGMLAPLTPMGMSLMKVFSAQALEAFGIATEPGLGNPMLVDVAGRLYLDLTPLARNKTLRAMLPKALEIYGPRVSGALARVLDDPRFAPVPGRPFPLRKVVAVAARFAPGVIAGVVGALARPKRARARALRAAAHAGRLSLPREGSAAERLRRVQTLLGSMLSQELRDQLPPLWAGLLGQQVAVGLLNGVAPDSEVAQTQRGMPHNVTTEMDLALWRLAAAAGGHRELLLRTPPEELAARYLTGELPDLGLAEFLRRYGHRGAAEVDVGVAHWADDPTPLFTAIAGYLRVTDPEQAPDRRFARAAREAEAKINELVQRARRTRPVRARIAGFLLHRTREIAGLRELPKFTWLQPLAQVRRQLLAAGAKLVDRGLLDRADDIMFLDLPEATAAADGADLRELIAQRRATHTRELRRRSVPGLLLSDGTDPEALAPAGPAADGALVGMAGAPGRASGPARVVLDPATARVEPGEILVAPTTDPGWTPLFLTAAGLVTETGSPMAHGPTVAREYGIPAVICVRAATRRITTGQRITMDGAAGTVLVEDEPQLQSEVDKKPQPH